MKTATTMLVCIGLIQAANALGVLRAAEAHAKSLRNTPTVSAR